MIAITYSLLAGAGGVFAVASAIVAHDVFVMVRPSCHVAEGTLGTMLSKGLPWRTTAALLVVAWGPLLLGLTMAGR